MRTMEATPTKEPGKTRKPYTITKQREKWTDEEHRKFLEAVGLYGRAWRRIQEHVGTKTSIQIRSHAQKFFHKLQKGIGGMSRGHPHGIDIPPPRPKRKPSDEEKVNNCSKCLAWPSTDEVLMDAKGKKSVEHATDESMNQAFRKCNSCASSYCGNNNACHFPEHLSITNESIMNGNFTNPQLNFSPEERYQLLTKINETFATSKHSLQDLNLSFNPTRSVTYMPKGPSTSLNDENASIALSGLTANSFPKLQAEASIAASLLPHPFVDFSSISDTNVNFGEAKEKDSNISSSISAIIAATVEAAAAWWRFNGLLPSPFQSNISSAKQTMIQNPAKESKDHEGDSGTKESTKMQSCATILEPSSPETVEKMRIERTEKPPNQYLLSSILEGINEVNQVPSKHKHDPSSCDSNTSPFAEAVNVRQLRNAGRFNKPYNERPKQGPLAFEALFTQKVLPQSFGPLHMDDDELDLNLGKKEALGLQIDLNTENVCSSAEEEKTLSLNLDTR